MKRNNFPYYRYKLNALLLVFAFFVQVGCSNSFLEVPPQGQTVATQFWVNGDDATKAGIDVDVYPLSATYRVGINVTF